MPLPHRIIGHKDFHIVDSELKTYVDSYDSMCLSRHGGTNRGSTSLFNTYLVLNLQL
jgi:hypothetical protein